jgi:hypothetical protein
MTHSKQNNTMACVVILSMMLLPGEAFSENKIQARGVAERDLIANAFGLRLGMSVADCRKNVSWAEVQPSEVQSILVRDPFARKFSFTRAERTAIWTDANTNASGWPNFIIGIFGSSNKTELVDLFYVMDGHQLPLLPGRYETFLRNLTPGANITEVFDHLGREMGDYYREQNGKWRVSFLYTGLKTRFIRIDVDAASGVVVKVRDVTI